MLDRPPVSMASLPTAPDSRPIRIHLDVMKVLSNSIPFVAALLGVVFTAEIHAQLVVTNTADSGPGSLRQTILDAPPDSTITFAPALSGETLLLTSGQITMDKSVSLDASALPNGITLDGNLSSRILLIVSNSPVPIVTVDSLTFAGGSVGGSAGGAIRTQPSTTLIVRRCTFYDNHADAGSGDGGAISSDGQLMVENSTFTLNSSIDRGGAIRAVSGTATFQNVTLTGNTAFQGGGIYNDAATLNLTNTIVAGNSSVSSGPNIFGGINGAANDLTSGDPQLAPLGNYGGPTPTMPPLPGSPAIDEGLDTGSLPATDQRGFNRLIGAAVDIGAVEGSAISHVLWRLGAPGRGHPQGNTFGGPDVNFVTETGTANPLPGDPTVRPPLNKPMTTIILPGSTPIK